MPNRNRHVKSGLEMLDTILLGAGIGLFLLGIIYVYACERV